MPQLEDFQAPAGFSKICLLKNTLGVHICYPGGEERPSSLQAVAIQGDTNRPGQLRLC